MIHQKLWIKEELYRTYRQGVVQTKAFLEDFVFLIFGMLELFESTGDIDWLTCAKELQEVQDQNFWDEDQAGYWMVGKQNEALLTREKPFYDGAEPSPNSVAVSNLLKLYVFTEENRYRDKAKLALTQFSVVLDRGPSVAPWMASALMTYLTPSQEILIVQKEKKGSMLDAELRKKYLPFSTRLSLTEKERKGLEKEVPWVRERSLKGDQIAFVCENGTCQLPITTPEQLATLL